MGAFGIDIAPEAVVIYGPGTTKEQALESLVDCMEKTDVFNDREAFRCAIHERESIMSTGIGSGVAIPHVRISGVKRPTVGVGISQAGIDFDTLDDAPVHIVVLFAMPQGAQKEYLSLLAQTMLTLKVPGFRDRLLASESPEDALKVLNQPWR